MTWMSVELCCWLKHSAPHLKPFTSPVPRQRDPLPRRGHGERHPSAGPEALHPAVRLPRPAPRRRRRPAARGVSHAGHPHSCCRGNLGRETGAVCCVWVPIQAHTASGSSLIQKCNKKGEKVHPTFASSANWRRPPLRASEMRNFDVRH